MMLGRHTRKLPTDVYRVRDVNGDLLYVGISVNFFSRAKEHRTYSSWWPLACDGTLETYSTRRDAEIVEARAIRDESPRFNVTRYPILADCAGSSPEPQRSVVIFWEDGEVWWTDAA